MYILDEPTTGLDVTTQAHVLELLKDIAKEKAGIIKSGVPVVISEFQKETYSVFEEKAKNLNSDIFLSNSLNKFKTDLIGDFQHKNIKKNFRF